MELEFLRTKCSAKYMSASNHPSNPHSRTDSNRWPYPHSNRRTNSHSHSQANPDSPSHRYSLSKRHSRRQSLCVSCLMSFGNNTGAF